MRLEILTNGLNSVQRLQLRLIKQLIGHPVGPIAMQSYRPDFFGHPLMIGLTQAQSKNHVTREALFSWRTAGAA